MRSWVLAILLVAVGTIACQRSISSHNPAGSEKQKLANELRRKVAAHLKQETDLKPCGTIGQMMNKVQVLGLSFYYYKPLDIVEGRKLLIKAMNEMMEAMNQDTQLRPYLGRHPVTPWNVEIEIFIHNSDGRDVTPGSLWIVEAEEGILQYKIDNPATKRLTTVYKETYAEAVQRLADPSLPLVPFEPDPRNPQISQEELSELRKGISFVGDDGSIWHLGENGCWVKDPRSENNGKK